MATVSNATITNNQDPWSGDLGTSDHLTENLNNLSIQSLYKGLDQVTVGNGQTLPINHISNASLHTKYHKFLLGNVLHVPRIALNLLSVHKFYLHSNCSCHFDANELKIQDILTSRILYKGLSENGAYSIYSKNFSKHPSSTHASSPQLHTIYAFHVQKQISGCYDTTD